MMNYATSAAIDIVDLRVMRRGRAVIPGLTTSIQSGQVTVLLGPSGCGKTTLMRSIIGVQKVASGTLTV
ncbi:MAG: ATP-binding cassette domain-containing protein, partial [Nocardioidaceae bacterium]